MKRKLFWGIIVILNIACCFAPKFILGGFIFLESLLVLIGTEYEKKTGKDIDVVFGLV